MKIPFARAPIVFRVFAAFRAICLIGWIAIAVRSQLNMVSGWSRDDNFSLGTQAGMTEAESIARFGPPMHQYKPGTQWMASSFHQPAHNPSTNVSNLYIFGTTLYALDFDTSGTLLQVHIERT